MKKVTLKDILFITALTMSIAVISSNILATIKLNTTLEKIETEGVNLEAPEEVNTYLNIKKFRDNKADIVARKVIDAYANASVDKETNLSILKENTTELLFKDFFKEQEYSQNQDVQLDYISKTCTELDSSGFTGIYNIVENEFGFTVKVHINEDFKVDLFEKISHNSVKEY